MKVLFLDCDEVLNSHGTWMCHEFLNNHKFEIHAIDVEKLALLSYVVTETQCNIVLISSWRLMMTLDTFHEKLVALGWPHPREILIARTAYGSEGGHWRGYEVQDYLNEHPEIEKYCILEDGSDFLDNQLPFLVQCNYQIGMSIIEAERCIRLLNGVDNENQ